MLKFKLDENFSPSLTQLFTVRDYDAESVLDENLSGAPDTEIYDVCLQENRCLITLDMDFANILRFPAQSTPGIIVIRPNQIITIEVMRRMLEILVKELESASPAGCLWILEPHQLRMRKPKD
jgi:predicted nuclease of predicted toxin-antitoxin system